MFQVHVNHSPTIRFRRSRWEGLGHDTNTRFCLAIIISRRHNSRPGQPRGFMRLVPRLSAHCGAVVIDAHGVETIVVDQRRISPALLLIVLTRLTANACEAAVPSTNDAYGKLVALFISVCPAAGAPATPKRGRCSQPQPRRAELQSRVGARGRAPRYN